MNYAGLTLQLESPLHIGSGRGGMLLRSHGFVPGHVLAYALAAAVGKALGGIREDFTKALELVQTSLRCGPLLILDEERGALLPYRDRAFIESHYLVASNHVTLDHHSMSAVESALFEVEAISSRVVAGPQRGKPVRLAGGVWYQETELAGNPLQTWFRQCLLGGELKAGLGRIRLRGWAPNAACYAGRWPVDGKGLKLTAGEILAGPSLESGSGTPLQPWLGRLFDPIQGFGRRFSGVALVRMDARCPAGRYLPAVTEVGLGCWSRHDDAA